MGTRLYVGNLSYNVTEPELRDVFAEGGRNVVEVKIVMDRDTGPPARIRVRRDGQRRRGDGGDLVADRARDSGAPHQRQRGARARARAAAAAAAGTAAVAVGTAAAAVVAAAAAAVVAAAAAATVAAAAAAATTARAAAAVSPRRLVDVDRDRRGSRASRGERGSASRPGSTRRVLRERAQAFGVREDHLAALGLDQALALELRQRQRHGLARRADQVRHLLVRDLEADDQRRARPRRRARGRGSAAARPAWRRRP